MFDTISPCPPGHDRCVRVDPCGPHTQRTEDPVPDEITVELPCHSLNDDAKQRIPGGAVALALTRFEQERLGGRETHQFAFAVVFPPVYIIRGPIRDPGGMREEVSNRHTWPSGTTLGQVPRDSIIET